MQPATKQQVKAINAILASRGLMEVKKEMMLQFTANRTDSSRALTVAEAAELLIALNKGVMPSLEEMQRDRMQRKCLAISRTVGLTKKIVQVTADGIKNKLDYNHFNAWLLKYGYLHKPLKHYTIEELPMLVTQMEKMEADYLKKL